MVWVVTSLVIFCLPAILSAQWTYLFGNESANAPSNYNTPYPGGLQQHSMVADPSYAYFYVFGGAGYIDDTSSGTL